MPFSHVFRGRAFEVSHSFYNSITSISFPSLVSRILPWTSFFIRFLQCLCGLTQILWSCFVKISTALRISSFHLLSFQISLSNSAVYYYEYVYFHRSYNIVYVSFRFVMLFYNKSLPNVDYISVSHWRGVFLTLVLMWRVFITCMKSSFFITNKYWNFSKNVLFTNVYAIELVRKCLLHPEKFLSFKGLLYIIHAVCW